MAILGLFAYLLFSTQRAAERRYSAALARVEYSDAPRDIVDLDARQTRTSDTADTKLAAVIPELESINSRVFRLYNDQGMTDAGRDTMEVILRDDTDLLAQVFDITASKSYWSHRRFATLEDMDDEEINSETTSLHDKRARTAARYLTHVFSYALRVDDASTAIKSATAALRLANLLADQPLTQQCYISYVLRGMSLSLMEHSLSQWSLTEAQSQEIEGLIRHHSADATFAAMLETERAVRISDYEQYRSQQLFRAGAMADLLDFIENRTVPNGMMATLNMGRLHGEFVVDVNTLDRTRAELCDQERRVLERLERPEN